MAYGHVERNLVLIVCGDMGGPGRPGAAWLAGPATARTASPILSALISAEI